MAFDWGNAFKGMGGGGLLGGPIGMLGGGLLGGLFGGNSDPSKEANKYLDKIPNAIGGYYDPYIKAGQGSLNKVGGEYDTLLADPNALIARLGAGYKESPGFQWQRDQGLNAIQNAQAAGGMTGTGQHQQLAGELATNLANQDYQNFLKQSLGLYGMGLQGHQGLSEMGLKAGGSLADQIAQVLAQKAAYGYQGKAGQNSGFGSLLSGLGGLGSLFGL